MLSTVRPTEDNQEVITTHQQHPPIIQDRQSPEFQLDVTRASPQLVMKWRDRDFSRTHGTQHIEYSDNESRENLTEHSTPSEGQQTTVSEGTVETSGTKTLQDTRSLRDTSSAITQAN